jgi:hypothetical protein
MRANVRLAEHRLKIVQMSTCIGGSIATMVMRLVVTLDKVLIEYMFVDIITVSETCYMYKTILLTI